MLVLLHLIPAGAIDALIQAGANTEASRGRRWTPLLSATEYCSISAMHTLLRHGASLTAQDTDGDTPLNRACYWQHNGLDATVGPLLRRGADEAAVNNTDETPADLLDYVDDEDGKRWSEAEIERVRLLPTRAPADRAWRRRSWLVMLRSCAETGRATTDETVVQMKIQTMLVTGRAESARGRGGRMWRALVVGYALG
ncbi:unnamed protein product [Ectocarpus sp. 4 AP-2014]